MSLSDDAKKRLVIALADAGTGAEAAAAVDLSTLQQKYLPTQRPDPGGANAAIPVDRSASIMIVTAGAETNTLANPTFVGQVLNLCMDTRAVGDRVVTAAARINQAGNTIMTFGAAGDAITLEGVTIAGALRWQVTGNDGVALS